MLNALQRNEAANFKPSIDEFMVVATLYRQSIETLDRTLYLYWEAKNLTVVPKSAPNVTFRLGSESPRLRLRDLEAEGYQISVVNPRPKHWVIALAEDLSSIRRSVFFVLVFVVCFVANALPVVYGQDLLAQIYPLIRDQLTLTFTISSLYLAVFGLFSAATQRADRTHAPDELDFSNLGADQVLLSWVIVSLCSGTFALLLSVMAGEWSPWYQVYCVIFFLSLAVSSMAPPISDIVPFFVERERCMLVNARIRADQITLQNTVPGLTCRTTRADRPRSPKSSRQVPLKCCSRTRKSSV